MFISDHAYVRTIKPMLLVSETLVLEGFVPSQFGKGLLLLVQMCHEQQGEHHTKKYVLFTQDTTPPMTGVPERSTPLPTLNRHT